MYKVLEMDQLGADVWDPETEGTDFNSDIPDIEQYKNGKNLKLSFYLNPKHIEAYPAVYAFLWYDRDLTPGERDALGGLFLSIEGKSRKKFFIQGRLNRTILDEELALAKLQAKKELKPAFLKMTKDKKNLPLIMYGFQHTHGKNNNFAKALQSAGFNFDGNDFTCDATSVVNEDGFGIFLLPNNQLEMILPRDGNIVAYLSDCTLYNNEDYEFRQTAIKVPRGTDFSKTLRSNLAGMKVSWNKWIRQAY